MFSLILAKETVQIFSILDFLLLTVKHFIITETKTTPAHRNHLTWRFPTPASWGLEMPGRATAHTERNAEPLTRAQSRQWEKEYICTNCTERSVRRTEARFHVWLTPEMVEVAKSRGWALEMTRRPSESRGSWVRSESVVTTPDSPVCANLLSSAIGNT